MQLVWANPKNACQPLNSSEVSGKVVLTEMYDNYPNCNLSVRADNLVEAGAAAGELLNLTWCFWSISYKVGLI